MTTPEKLEDLSLELSDIIQIISPLNKETHEQIYIIKYIDNKLIKLINTNSLSELIVNISDDGNLVEDFIAEIHLLDRNDDKGYIKQNNLKIDSWIDIHFSGDLPYIVTGKITNIEEDMIEITTTKNETIYIDFAYQGIPLDFNIKEINIRPEPKENIELDKPESDKPESDKPESDKENIEQTEEEYEMDFYVLPEESETKNIQKDIIDADNIIFGEELDEITETINIDDQYKRYSIESQTNDMLDDILSTIPAVERTNKVLNNIHTIIERYKQLRLQYSVFDDNLNANKPELKGANYKPLIDNLYNMSQKLYWILPVVTLKKKIYLESLDFDQDDYITTENNLLGLELNDQLSLYDNYTSNSQSNDKNKYQYLYQQLNEYFTPYVNNSNNEGILKEVNTDILALINNYDDYNTDVINVFSSGKEEIEEIVKKKYVLQQYNIGLKNGELTNNDKIHFNSFLTMPEPVVRFSAISLPETDILTRSNLNKLFFNYWQIFNKKTIVDSSEFTEENFLKGIRHYLFDTDDLDNDAQIDNKKPIKGARDDEDDEMLEKSKKEYSKLNFDEKFKIYLDSIIPKTKMLFEIIKKYINKPLNMVSIINYLEPFMIYRDDISFKQFQKMMFYIKEKLVEYKKTFQENKILFSELKVPVSKKSPLSILENLTSSQIEDLKDYSINTEIMHSSSEILRKIYIRDNGRLYSDLTSLSNIELQGLENFNEIINNQLLKIDIKSGCADYKISKKYTNEDDIKRDNNKKIYYDDEYDKTSYDYLQKFDKELKTLPENERLLFLSKKLQENKNVTPENSVVEAKAIIDGKKEVYNNSYAILDLDDNISYYKRSNNKWIIDNDITTNITDQGLCNIQPECLTVTDDCKNGDSIINQSLFKNILNEYDTKNAINSFELKENINKSLSYNKENLKALNTLNSENSFKVNDEQLSLGDESVSYDVVKSPHQNLRDIILGLSDFVKKQTYIQMFVEKYTRPPTDEESPYWLYCTETSTKLLPKFISTLANSFFQNDDYVAKLDEICREVGVLSDDGEAWVDKHSGYNIKNIDFDTDEGYDDSGFKAKSRSEMIQDLAITTAKANSEEKLIMTPETLMIINLITAITGNMGISVNSDRDFIVSNVLFQLDTNLPDELSYKKLAEQARAKGKKTPEYNFKKNNLILLFTISYTFVSIQTMIPTPKTKKTFPNCIKSFSGYPLEINDNFDGLTYMACVIYKIKSSEEPWNTLKGLSQLKIFEKVKSLIDSILLKDKVIQEKITNKIFYNNNTKIDDIIPDDVDVKNWETFLPPLKKPDIKATEPINDAYIKSLYNNIEQNNNTQNQQISIIKGKIIHFSLYIQIIITNIIKDALPLLMNSSKEPFIDNVCCNDTKNVIDFLNNNNPSILKTNAIIDKLSNILSTINSLDKPSILFCDINTRKKYPIIQDTLSENTIYKSFIVYCNINKNAVLSKELTELCINDTSKFNSFDSIEEKIRILKEEGKFYSIETFHQLHRLIHTKIKINIQKQSLDSYFNLSQIVKSFDNQHDPNIPDELLIKINTLLDQKDTLHKNDSAEMRDIKNYLLTNNDTFKTNIKDFILRNLQPSSKKKRILDSFFSEFDTLFNKTHNIMTGDDINMYEITDHLLRFLTNIILVFPNIIVNKIDYKKTTIPSHWNISQIHTLDIKNIITNHYQLLIDLYDDNIITSLLNKIKYKLYNIILIANNIVRKANVINKEIGKYTFDNEICTLLFQYFVLFAMNQHIVLSSDEQPIIIQQSKQEITQSVDVVQDMDNGDISEIDVVMGEKKTNYQKISNILMVYIEMYMNTKKSTVFNYPEFMSRVLRSKEKEKDQITSYLKNMTDDERRVEDIFKANQLERWGKGLQKGLTQYVKETYDEEREVLEKNAIMESKLNQKDYVTDMNKDIYMLDYEMENATAQEIETEEYDMSRMHNDDDYDEMGDEDVYDVGNRDFY